MPRKPVATVLLLVAVLGALLTTAVAPAAPAPRDIANRGWDAPPADVFAELD